MEADSCASTEHDTTVVSMDQAAVAAVAQRPVADGGAQAGGASSDGVALAMLHSSAPEASAAHVEPPRTTHMEPQLNVSAAPNGSATLQVSAAAGLSAARGGSAAGSGGVGSDPTDAMGGLNAPPTVSPAVYMDARTTDLRAQHPTMAAGAASGSRVRCGSVAQQQLLDAAPAAPANVLEPMQIDGQRVQLTTTTEDYEDDDEVSLTGGAAGVSAVRSLVDAYYQAPSSGAQSGSRNTSQVAAGGAGPSRAGTTDSPTLFGVPRSSLGAAGSSAFVQPAAGATVSSRAAGKAPASSEGSRAAGAPVPSNVSGPMAIEQAMPVFQPAPVQPYSAGEQSYASRTLQAQCNRMIRDGLIVLSETGDLVLAGTRPLTNSVFAQIYVVLHTQVRVRYTPSCQRCSTHAQGTGGRAH